jgi:hypothetical protein
MTIFHNISSVARYEARTLRRSWFFRLFSLGALFIFTIMNIGMFSPIGDEDWEIASIPASVPLINLYLLNIGQAIVVIFLAADFLKRDKKLDTNEVLYTRSMSNFEYVIGKTWGILRLFISLNLVILLISMVINIISKTMAVDLAAYCWYLLIISVPTILFSLGFAFLMMSLIRNQAITFLLLLGMAAVNMFYLWHRAGTIFDYMAFGLPVFKSGMIGFENPALIINQRLLYFFLGLAFVLASVLIFRRLPQSKVHTWLSAALMVIFTGGAIICGLNVFSEYSKGLRAKQEIIETNRKFENNKFPDIISNDIELAHSGEKITASAKISFKNNNSEPLAKYTFSLNPYLIVSKVSSSGKDIGYVRTGHVLEIEPSKPLQAGETDSVIIEYSGGISEAFCYPDFSDNIKEYQYRIAMLNVRKRQAFLQPDYVLLTPETHWYPVAALNYYPANPARIKIDFSRYTLRVKEEPGLSPVSQGLRRSENGFSIFTPGSPLTGMTLAIGNYISDTLMVDSIRYISFHYPGNDYYKKELAELKDTLPQMISGFMTDLETTFSTKYPFKTLSLVEVPVQYHSYPRENTQTRAEVQPSMVLLPERMSTLQLAGFAKQFSRQKKRMIRNNQVITDKELKVRLFNSFIRNTFISGENFRIINGQAANEPVRYRLGPSFYFFKNNFYSDEYPVINAVFESHLQKVVQPATQGGGSINGSLSDNDRANLVLRKYSFRDILRKRPGGDTLLTVLTLKGDWLFNLLRAKAGIEEFNKWFSGYIDDHKFRPVNITDLNNDIKSRFGFEFYPLLSDWFNGNCQPGFTFRDFRVSEIVVGDRSRYQVIFTVSNNEPAPGIFNISFRTGGQESEGNENRGQSSIPMQGRGMDASDVSRIVYMNPKEAKRIGILLDYQPRAMMINTLYSLNVPGQITMPAQELIRVKGSIKPFEGEMLLPGIPEDNLNSEIIIDNEDPGFSSGASQVASPLRKLLGKGNNNGNTYESISYWGTPEHWQPVISNTYYGKYILSSVYTKSGKGERSVTWKARIDKPGYYDVYCYVGKSVNITAGQQQSGQNQGREAEQQFRDMHYRVYHDEGMEDIALDYENADGGWYNLGRFYLSKDSAKVELSNQSTGRMVIGDAIKWVRQE